MSILGIVVSICSHLIHSAYEIDQFLTNLVKPKGT